MNNPAKSPYKRCPSCGSRVDETEAVCDVCGHEFGTTQAIPPVKLPSSTPAVAPDVVDSDDSAEDRPQAEPMATPRPARGRAASGLPWGVIGVAGVILALIAAAFVLSPSGLNQNADQPTIQVIINDPGLAGTPLAEVAPADTTQTPSTATTAPTDAAPTITSIPSPTPIPPTEYTIRGGDTCGGIASRFGVSLEDFTALNQLDPDDCLIRLGDKVFIPAPTPTAGPTVTIDPNVTQAPAETPGVTATLPPEIVYVVKGGDTCGEIANRFNITVDLIIQQNNLDANCLIGLNQVLTITFATPTPAATVTPFILQTPTPRAGYDAPIVTAPQDGATISETQEIVTLQWLTVGLLKPDEWYVVQVQPSGAITVPVFETKATSLKLTQDILGEQLEGEIAWWVQVKRSSTDAAGARIYADLSQPSPVRRFVWRRPIDTPTPTPSP
jgi:LysM repeat protein